MIDDRERLRREMRARRRQMSRRHRESAALGFARVITSNRLLRRGQRVAFYLAYDNEADLSKVILSARRRGCFVYLPAIASYRRHRMVFRRFTDPAALASNRYGILEPTAGDALDPRRLDLVFAPLVAFDDDGARLGSGAGFYDRALRHLRARRQWRRPRLIGVGYEFQKVPALRPARWDVLLDAIVTEARLYRVARSAPERP